MMGIECVQDFNITENLTSIVVMPGGTNCFSCEILGLDQSICNVTWQVSNGTNLVPVSSSPHAETVGDELLIARPETGPMFNLESQGNRLLFALLTTATSSLKQDWFLQV